MTKQRKKPLPLYRNWLSRLVIFSGIMALILTAAACMTVFMLSDVIRKQFDGRRWAIPSAIYSDQTLLYPGSLLKKAPFENRMHQGHFSPAADRQFFRPGEWRDLGHTIEIYIPEYAFRGKKIAAVPIRLHIRQHRITTIERMDTGAPLPMVALPPVAMAQVFGKNRELRTLVSYQHLPPHLIHAFLAAEDHRFFDHPGIDPTGIARALFHNLKGSKHLHGGSTLTQQLAKNYFLTPERTLNRKLKEVFISLAIEWAYPKETILEIYLNEIYFGQMGAIAIHGIGEAARFYFQKSVSNLSVAESAMLAGLIKGPGQYAPHRYPDRCLKRRNQVLDAMKRFGYLTEADRAVAENSPLGVRPRMRHPRIAPYFIDTVLKQITALYTPETLNSMGFSIYTTLDPEVQAAAEAAVSHGLSRITTQLKKKHVTTVPEAALVVMNPRTGTLLAMVGGSDYAHTQFNRITHARRQPGSCFKPILAAAALDRFSPSTLLSNTPQTYTLADGSQWQPKNSHPIDAKQLSMRRMLADSINIAAVDLGMRIGLERVIETAEAMGLPPSMKPYPSLALGAFEVTPLEMATAYCSFAADGVRPAPLSILDICNASNAVLERRFIDMAQVLSPEKAFLVTSMLESVMTDGTGKSIRKLGVHLPVAGKTGTTSDYRDAWFIGYTPDLLALVWVGNDENAPIYHSGASAALPIWAELMRHIPNHLSGAAFSPPPGVIQRKTCCNTGEPAGWRPCRCRYDEWYLKTGDTGTYGTTDRLKDWMQEVFRTGREWIGD
ncbi:MAG: penicillin-binding protein 1B [Deltaproteobacteria bacterium]|nr:MAG: penicillin-binding protein 1B [Deltaproteobacteria bacterium]